MTRYFGLWLWDEPTRTLTRAADRATLRLLGPSAAIPSTGAGPWFTFAITCPEGDTLVPVQHRLIGFNAQLRTLYWRADFTRLAELGASPPRDHAQWSAFERIAADGLACWPEQTFGERPDWVGVEGGWSDGAFCRDRFRLYERQRVTTLLTGGHPPEAVGEEPRWRFHPLDPRVPAPDLSPQLSPRALDRALDRLIARGPALVAGDRALVLDLDQHGSLHATYIDREFVSDRTMISGEYRTQEQYWGASDYAKVTTGTLRRATGRPADRAQRRGFFANLVAPPLERTNGREDWAMDPILLERIGNSLAEALFAIPDRAFESARVVIPPLRLSLDKAWLQAGYLLSRLKVARQLATEDFIAAFADPPPAAMRLATREGLTFSEADAVLTDPYGRTLRIASPLEQATTTPRFRLLCSAFGLNWPVVVHRSLHDPAKPVTWTLDHAAALALWRESSRRDLPDPQAWDLMRQFLDDAILSWSDHPATGSAAQRLVAHGGVYDGKWHGPELVRTLDRPHPWHEANQYDTGPWLDYAPTSRWRRTDDLPADLPDRNYQDYAYVYARGAPHEPPIPFAKAERDGTATLTASVSVISHHREETWRADYCDLRSPTDWLRLAGVRSSMWLSRVSRLDDAQAAKPNWSPGDTFLPDPALWRTLRDAAETGLRAGEQVTVHGTWILDRFHAGATRHTLLSSPFSSRDFTGEVAGQRPDGGVLARATTPPCSSAPGTR
jgi:hypothetical protein